MFIILITIFITYLLHTNNNLNEQKQRIKLAEKLVPKRDFLSEFLFKDIQQNINSDTIFANLVNQNEFDDDFDILISDYLSKKYFNNYFNKYNILITVCDSDKILSIQPDNFLINCDTFFNDLILNYGIETEVENLFYQNDFSSSRNYIGILKFSNTQKTIFIELFSKYVPKGLGYPELLIDKNFVLSPDLSDYSYAKYFDYELFYKFGKFLYSIDVSKYQSSLNNSCFFDLENYNHYFYQVDDSSVLILSKRNPTFLDVISPFSYLLVFYILFILLFLFITNYSKINIFSSISLRNRIQVSIISLIFLSFIAIGLTSLIYLIKLNNDKNNEILSEKSHSVLIELEHKLANEEELNDELKTYLSEILYKFSLVFFSDINLYNTDGRLLATSRPEIFDKGLVSQQMNSQAYFQLNYDQTLLYIHKENISNQEYLSAYLPFWNSNNKLIAYLNLPYFAKQSELKSDIFTFLVAFINIYVILIALSIFIALIISRHITKPLQIIKEKFASLNLTKTNEKIVWHKNDEIGNLILEYNRMIDELSESANLLAKSEREGAWRNMAKQVAHEIKNPLTPMKLSIQYLQKAWNDNATDFSVRLERFSKTLIEQIDTLSQIATEFSDFAKMPVSNNERIDLSQKIYSSILLFSDYQNIVINFKPETDKKFFIYADKKQILRVFNNLLKNSVQALKQVEKGEINISIKSSSENIIVKISDNGIGIPKNQIDKIFTPSFTTKSYGMGIGLAIVKSIVNNSGGEIYFESVVDFGTTFTISFPIPKS
ncbi:MAG: HAMP domain-containing histidine kinase [Bacteroidales bacterium]|nr:HAMP domain-containing histidine kinase [Bacteroidales bacterium]